MPGKPLTAVEIVGIVALHTAGWSVRAIAAHQRRDTGTIRKVLEESGRTVRRCRQPTGEERARLTAAAVAAYRAGAPLRRVAADLGQSYGWVHRALTDAGTPLRQWGGHRRGRQPPPRP